MKAIRLHARGGPEAFAYEEAPQPHPGEGEVLVRVHAAGVIPTELSWVPTWTTPAGKPRPLPVIPGHEFSGEVAAAAAGRLRSGTRRYDPTTPGGGTKRRASMPHLNVSGVSTGDA
jgi:NADPH:quinone reductase-like Zn-dependent oxidoreductase